MWVFCLFFASYWAVKIAEVLYISQALYQYLRLGSPENRLWEGEMHAGSLWGSALGKGGLLGNTWGRMSRIKQMEKLNCNSVIIEASAHLALKLDGSSEISGIEARGPGFVPPSIQPRGLVMGCELPCEREYSLRLVSTLWPKVRSSEWLSGEPSIGNTPQLGEQVSPTWRRWMWAVLPQHPLQIQVL